MRPRQRDTRPSEAPPVFSYVRWQQSMLGTWHARLVYVPDPNWVSPLPEELRVEEGL